MKKIWKNNKGIFLTVCGVVLLLVLSMLIDGNKEVKVVSSDIAQWKEKAQSGETVVTVIGLSYCDYCKEYKPIIAGLSDEYDFELFYFNIDELATADSSALTDTFELEKYTGSSPYTFVVKDSKFVTDVVGYMPEEDTKTFLQGASVIN